jgi:hypothetical protein
MYWDVIKVQSIAPRELEVQFADGLSGVLHIDASFCTGVFDPLLNDQAVGTALASNGVLTWPNGLDLAPDTMYHAIKRSPDSRYDLRR